MLSDMDESRSGLVSPSRPQFQGQRGLNALSCPDGIVTCHGKTQLAIGIEMDDVVLKIQNTN